MARKDNLGDRMKSYYEDRSKTYLTRRTPVIIRLDGCHFHSFTNGFMKPFDDILIRTMQITTNMLCRKIQGCVLGYTQSDEITLILTDYKDISTDAWYNYSVQKMCSVAASIATLHFNKTFKMLVERFKVDNGIKGDDHPLRKQLAVYERACMEGATFDARCFNIPRDEVTNCLLYRQMNAVRNSINSLGQAYFSHKELMGKSTSDVKRMLLEKGVSWDEIESYKKRGTCVVKDMFGQWETDTDIPMFKGEDRNYIERLI